MATTQPLKGGTNKIYSVINNFNKGIDNLLVHYTFSQMVIDGYKNIYIDIFVLCGIVIGYLKKERSFAVSFVLYSSRY